MSLNCGNKIVLRLTFFLSKAWLEFQQNLRHVELAQPNEQCDIMFVRIKENVHPVTCAVQFHLRIHSDVGP